MKTERERAWDAEGRWCGTGKALPRPDVEPSKVTHEGCTPFECGGEFQCSKCNKLVGWCFGHGECTRCNKCCARRCPSTVHTASFEKRGILKIEWRVTCSCGQFAGRDFTRDGARALHRDHKDQIGAE